MPFEAIVYPAREVPPVPFIAHRDINTRADVFHNRARDEGRILAQKGGLCVYFPSGPSFPDVTSDGEGSHFVLAHRENRFTGISEMNPNDMNEAAMLAIQAAHKGYIVGSDHGERTSTHPTWRMFNMQFVKRSFPKPSQFQHAWETPDALLWEPSASLLRKATRNFLDMFGSLNVLPHTHFGDYRVYNGAVAELQRDISPAGLAKVLNDTDTQLLSLWHRLDRKYGKVYRRESCDEQELNPCDAYAANLTRHKGMLASRKVPFRPSYSWALTEVEPQGNLLFALSPHIRGGGGFLGTLGIVPQRTETPIHSHKPALERAREAVNGFAYRWGLIQGPKQPRGTFSC